MTSKPTPPPVVVRDHLPGVRKMVVTFDLSYADYLAWQRQQAAEPSRH